MTKYKMKTETLLFLSLILFQTNKVLSNDDAYDEFAEFDNEFQEFEKKTEFTRNFNKGYRNWEERCLKIGGEEVLKKWQKEQENLIFCFMEHFDFDEIQSEIDVKKQSGDLDEVFKKYCGVPVNRVRGCLEDFLTISHQCLHEDDRAGLNITLRMVDAAINFTCHNSGDRIALFMAESGLDCVTEHQDQALACLNTSVPEIFQNDMSSTSKMHFYVFQQENCRKGDSIIQCVEESLMGCKDPTPSNLVHGLLRSMKEETPCARAAEGWRSGAVTLLPLLSTYLVIMQTYHLV